MRKVQLFLLTFVALLGAVTVSAADVTVYIDPVGDGTWLGDNAKISVNVYTDGQSNNTFVTPTTYEGNVLTVTFADTYDRMIIVRGANQDAWGWNQTENITPVDNTLYKANGYSNDQLAYTTVNPYITAPAAGYVCDFNTAIAVPSSNTASPVFQVSTGWTRIAPSAAGDGYGPYYMRYTYSSTEGVSESGTLLANAQCAPQSTYDGSISTVNDYIVTPKVSGTVTLMVKGSSSASSSYPSFISFYAIDDDATTVGDEISATLSGDINNDDFVTATLTLTEATRIAIRGQWVYMDNFTATEAEVPEVKSLTVTNVMSEAGQSGTTGTNPIFEQQSDGKLLVKLQVALQNTGSVAFVAGTTEDYTLTLATASYSSGTKTYYEDFPITITEDLAVGASTTIDVEKAVNYTDTYGAYRYWFVRENVSGTTSSSYRYATSVAYEPKFIFRVAESTSTSSLSGTQAYGLIGEETTNHYEIANTGTAPLVIKSITLPEGFTSANLPEIPTEGLTIAKGETQALDITLPITTQGAISGTLTIVYLDKNGAEADPYTLAFSGNVLAEGTWAADFSVASSSETNYPAGSVAENGIRFGTTYISSDNYDGYLYSYTSSSYASENNKFITPKLHAAAGDKLTFDVRRDDSSSSTYNLKVYVSTDRKTWSDPVYSVTAADLTSSFETKEISFDAEGDYYVAFAIYGVRVDNIIGLTKVDVAHDLYIKSVSWPDASVKSGTSLSKPSIDVIPLTTEAEDAYTVKYVCGETVLAEGTPVALTASANSSKTFSFSWTPEVESTTAYPGTKIVFEFTDDTKIESETFDLTVTNEPIFHFVSSLPSSKYNEPSDVSTPIAFGKTNAADTKSYYVYNWGSAPLTVKSIAVPTGFTATPAEQFTVAAFDENDLSVAAQPVEITFSATEAGEYSGDLVVTYLDGSNAEQTFTLAVSGTKLDPNKFYANFDNPTSSSIIWPAGLVYESKIQTSATSGYAPYNYYVYTTSLITSDNKIITPLLEATAGESFSFDVAPYSSYTNGTVNVYLSTDRETWGDAIETITVESSQGTSTFTTKSVTIETAGQYYVGLEITNAKVDELYGLTVAEVAHDWKIAEDPNAPNIPSEAMQNVATTATVNILNFGLQDEAAEDITVTAYVNGEAAGTGTAVAIPMNHKLTDAGTQLSVNFQSPKAGTFPVYIEVKAGDYSVATEPVDVVFAEEEASSDVATGESAGTDSTTPLNLFYKNSETIALYTPANLGLSAGAKIKSITWKGYTSSSHTSTLKVYYQWTDATTISAPASTGNYDVTDMTAAIEPTSKTWTVGGSSSELQDQIVVNFDTPIVYESGKSLLILVSSSASGYSSNNAIQFEKTNTTGYAYQHQNDGTEGTFNSSWSAKNLPLIRFGLEIEPVTIAGTVSNAENATVTLVSTDGDNIQYQGTTDSEGNYSINVIQSGRTYNVTVSAEGFESVTEENVTFSGNVTKNFALYIPKTLFEGETALGNWENSVDLTAADFALAEAGDKVRITLNNAKATREFTDNADWGTVYLYAWDANNAAVAGDWPGTALEYSYTNGDGKNVYSFTMPENAAGILFTKGSDGPQTKDITDLTHYGYYSTDQDSGDSKYWFWHWDNASVALQDATWATVTNASDSDLSSGVAVGAPTTVVFDIDDTVLAKLADATHVKGANATVTKVELLMQSPIYTLAEDAEGVVAKKKARIQIERTFKEGWNAVVLPFEITAEEVTEKFGADAEVAIYNGDSNNDGAVTVNFNTNTEAIAAGTPVLIYLNEAVSNVTFKSRAVVTNLNTAEGNTFDFVGTYTTADAAAGDYFIQGGKFVKATTGNTVKPFRSYLKLREGASARSINFVVDGDIVTAIDGLTVEPDYSNDVIYNLNGQKVLQPTKRGVYIINGKKVMMK